MSAFYFLGARLLGSSSRLAMWSDSQLLSSSTAFFCPKCGEIWGRVLTKVPEWFVATFPCQKHGGGSFIAPWRQAFEELPPEVLSYELEIRLNQLHFQPGETNGNESTS